MNSFLYVNYTLIKLHFFFFLKKTVFGKLSIMFKYKHQEILDGNISQWR